MFATIRSATLGGVGALALASSCVYAAPVSWSTPSGSNSQVSWTNGQSDKGLFGDPTVSGSSFLFFPNNFEAEASNGSAKTTSDRLSFTVTAAAGKEIQKVTIRELGDWSILGTGTVKATGALYLTNIAGPGFGTVWTDTLDVVYNDEEHGIPGVGINYVAPSRPTGDGSGKWEGYFEITLPQGVNSVQVVLNNILQASAGQGSTAFIQKKEVGDPSGGSPQFLVDVQVPEPTTFGLLAIGGALMLRRQRNNRKSSDN